jgi:hypothetical protein
MNKIIKSFLANPEWKDGCFFVMDFNIYAGVTAKAWRLPKDFKIRIGLN